MPFSPLLTSVAPETVAGPTDRPWMASSRCSERHRTGATSGVVATTNPLTSLLCIALGDWLDQPPGGGQAFGTKPGALWSWFFVPRCLAPNSSANIGSRNSDVGWAFRTAATTALSYLPPPPPIPGWSGWCRQTTNSVSEAEPGGRTKPTKDWRVSVDVVVGWMARGNKRRGGLIKGWCRRWSCSRRRYPPPRPQQRMTAKTSFTQKYL